MNHRIALPLAAMFCLIGSNSLADAASPTPGAVSLTVATTRHSVECPAPKREICVIRKPVGSGYRLLTQSVSLEDSGEYWLADFTKQLKGKQTDLAKQSFRVMGKDSDIHEIEISFAADPAATSKAAAKSKSNQKDKAK